MSQGAATVPFGDSILGGLARTDNCIGQGIGQGLCSDLCVNVEIEKAEYDRGFGVVDSNKWLSHFVHPPTATGRIEVMT